jgi:hypothetical protein
MKDDAFRQELLRHSKAVFAHDLPGVAATNGERGRRVEGQGIRDSAE